MLLVGGTCTGAISWQLAASAVGIHLGASAVLAVMFSVVCRRREELADDLTRRYVPEKELTKAHSLFSVGLPHSSRLHIRSGNSGNRRAWDRTLSYLEDKALFGQNARLWNVLLSVYSYAYLKRRMMPGEPDPAKQRKVDTRPRRRSTRDFEPNFFLGMSAGTFLVVLIMSGVTWSHIVLGIDDRLDVMDAPASWFIPTGLLVAGYLSCVIVLPFWATGQSMPVRRVFADLACGHFAALAGGCLALTFLVPGVGVLADIPFSWIVGVIMLLCATLVSFAFGLVQAFLWEVNRWFSPRDFKSLAKLAGAAFPAVLPILLTFSASLILVVRQSPAGAAGLIGTLAGILTTLIFSRGRISFEDEWWLLEGPLVLKVEGKSWRRGGGSCYRWSWRLPLVQVL